jgi:hypothetical protein
MAAHGYFPKSETWAPGEWGCGAFIVALLLCFILIGILVFIYMMIVKPAGTLTVVYELQAEEKTCPNCAEQVKSNNPAC